LILPMSVFNFYTFFTQFSANNQVPKSSILLPTL
jgi:hypothetical protein